MTEPKTIILPVAGRSSRFPGLRPKWLLTAPTGELMLERSLASVPEWRSCRVVIGALTDHLANGGLHALRLAFGDAIEIVCFDEQTSGPAETVAEMIDRAGVSGPVFIKDCDSWFEPSEDVFCDCVCFADLRTVREVRNIAAKSFLNLNENDLLLGLVEKVVSSNFISVGGYGFHDARVFQEAFARLQDARLDGEPFVSHVIMDAMRHGAVFKGIAVDGYVDVGTLEAWNAFRKRQSLYLVDLDGVVLRNAGQYTVPGWDDPDSALEANVEALRRLAGQGAQFVFITARPEQYRAKTERFLAGLGLSWHAAVFGVNHASRILINDYAGSNPFPAAVAINLARNDDKLATMLAEALS